MVYFPLSFFASSWPRASVFHSWNFIPPFLFLPALSFSLIRMWIALSLSRMLYFRSSFDISSTLLLFSYCCWSDLPPFFHYITVASDYPHLFPTLRLYTHVRVTLPKWFQVRLSRPENYWTGLKPSFVRQSIRACRFCNELSHLEVKLSSHFF